MTNTDCKNNHWRSKPIRQQPNWPDELELKSVVEKIRKLPALVYAGETRSLLNELQQAGNGKAFILQCGDCAEEFDRCHGPSIHNLLNVMLQMSVIISYAAELRVVTIGRIAGQYAKPRSSDFEQVGDSSIYSYRGDMVNRPEANPEARTPDPQRLLEGYFRSAATLNLLRAFTHGGYGGVNQANLWHKGLNCEPKTEVRYQSLIEGIRKSIKFLGTMGLDLQTPNLNQSVLYTSHEALLLEYEDALSRIDTLTGELYCTSAHMVWIGDRTRNINEAHVEFLKGVSNPIGIKVGPKYEKDEIKGIIRLLNPGNTMGRISLICRFGVNYIDKFLPELIRSIKAEGLNVVWLCDPMHGNTYMSESGYKSRRFNDIFLEIQKFFNIHRTENTIGAGVHLELTGDQVTECTGGSQELADKDLHTNFQTTCDPRLNATQSIELAFKIAEILV
jgi:3-deoxy-7-phosphoheptulonate synthase